MILKLNLATLFFLVAGAASALAQCGNNDTPVLIAMDQPTFASTDRVSFTLYLRKDLYLAGGGVAVDESAAKIYLRNANGFVVPKEPITTETQYPGSGREFEMTGSRLANFRRQLAVSNSDPNNPNYVSVKDRHLDTLGLDHLPPGTYTFSITGVIYNASLSTYDAPSNSVQFTIK